MSNELPIKSKDQKSRVIPGFGQIICITGMALALVAIPDLAGGHVYPPGEGGAGGACTGDRHARGCTSTWVGTAGDRIQYCVLSGSTQAAGGGCTGWGYCSPEYYYWAWSNPCPYT